MKQTSAPSAVIVQTEDKSCKLSAFVSSHLPRGLDCGTISVVARSAASPVADALVQLGPELALRGMRVRAIFTTLTAESGVPDWCTLNLPFAREVRLARHPRLIEAHEQLVIAGGTAWFGDCMRRDPAKRDAYEQYAGRDAAAVRIAASSFERLWRVCEPVAIRQGQRDLARMA